MARSRATGHGVCPLRDRNTSFAAIIHGGQQVLTCDHRMVEVQVGTCNTILQEGQAFLLASCKSLLAYRKSCLATCKSCWLLVTYKSLLAACRWFPASRNLPAASCDLHGETQKMLNFAYNSQPRVRATCKCRANSHSKQYKSHFGEICATGL